MRMALIHRLFGTLFCVKQRQRFEEDDILALGSIAFSEYAGFADYLAAGLFRKFSQGFHGAAGADYVVQKQDVFAFEAVNVYAVQAEFLYAFGGDGDIFHPDGVFHIGLDGFAGYDIAFHAELAGQVGSQRNALGFSREDYVSLG